MLYQISDCTISIDKIKAYFEYMTIFGVFTSYSLSTIPKLDSATENTQNGLCIWRSFQRLDQIIPSGIFSALRTKFYEPDVKKLTNTKQKLFNRTIQENED